MPEPGKAPRKLWPVAGGDEVQPRNDLKSRLPAVRCLYFSQCLQAPGLWKVLYITDGTFLPPWLAVLWMLFQVNWHKIIDK
jgi:hypothetical protein